MTVRVTSQKPGRPHKSTSALVPAAARSGELLSESEQELNGQAIDVFLRVVGGRAELTDVLSVGGTTSEIDKVTTLLLDPRYESFSLKRLCTMAGLTVADLFASYRKALVLRAHVEATRIIASKLVPVVDDVMTRAAPQRMVCPTCAGAASAAGSCSTCRGTGQVQTEPDLDRQKLALELGQLTEKKGGLIVQQNAIAASISSTQTGALEQLQQAVGDFLFSPSRRRGQPTDADLPIGVPPELHHSMTDPPGPIHGEYEPPLPFDDDDDTDDSDDGGDDSDP